VLRSPGHVGAWLAASAVCVGASGGCELQFTDPFSREASDLVSTVTVVEGPEMTVALSAELHPGRHDDGRLRSVEDLSLEVFGTPLGPVGLGHHGRRRYAAHWTRPREDSLSPEVRVPRVDQVAQGRDDLLPGTCGRSDREDRLLAAGDTVRFEAYCDLSDPSLRHVEWELEVRRADNGGLVAALRSGVTPPASISVPVEWLRQPGDPDLEARLTIVRAFVWNDAPGDDYRIALTTRWTFPWALRWAADPDSGAGTLNRGDGPGSRGSAGFRGRPAGLIPPP